MARLAWACALLALLVGSLPAEDPTPVSDSASYSMESSVEIAAVSETPQASGMYEVNSDMDSFVQVPVELSSFEAE